MRKNVKLNSNEWIDLIFEGRNKEYGAYDLRSTSWKRHLYALLVALIFTSIVISLPSVFDAVREGRERRKERLGGIEQAVELSELSEPEALPDEVIPEAVIPPPPVKATIQFTPPKIVDKVDDEQEMLTQEELGKSTVQISIATMAGVEEIGAVDIQDLVDKHQITAEKAPEPRVFVQQMPQFPGGGEAELHKWINKNIRYPQIALDNNIQGRVFMRFVVGADGNISNVEVLNGVDTSLDNEATRIIKAMPKWIPGRQDGVAVPVYYTVSIVFEIAPM